MSTTEGATVGLGVLGCGTVGAAFVELLTARVEAVARRTGVRPVVHRVAVRDVTRRRGDHLDPGLLTDDPAAVVADPDVDVVVELMGGVEPARTLVLEALRTGKPVVTANKELVAECGSELVAAAEAAGVDLLFEAAVGGGIPIVRPVRESLLGEPVRRILGIVNGTTNFILTRMADDGAGYDEALAEAQRLGYAEADPTADVEGHDAAAKIAILASIAFGAEVRAGDVAREGIAGLTADDIAFATARGLVVKLLAIAERAGDTLAVRVHPVLLPGTHPLAAVRGSSNAVYVEGDAVGELMFYGPGAGGRPTASAVLGDVVDAAVNLRKGSHASIGTFVPVEIADPDDLESELHIALVVADQPGVLAEVAGVFGRHGVSIGSMEQEGRGDAARLVFITHTARQRDVRATLAELADLDVVLGLGSVIRLLGGGEP